jgi:hypothetical protein
MPHGHPDAFIWHVKSGQPEAFWHVVASQRMAWGTLKAAAAAVATERVAAKLWFLCRRSSCTRFACNGMFSCRGASEMESDRAVKRRRETSFKSTTALLKWLAARGTPKRKARQFLMKSGCDSLESMALYLRFQLPPLQYANEDCVNAEMMELFGVGPKNARRIIVDLDVASAFS